jgi:hypothetical protein
LLHSAARRCDINWNTCRCWSVPESSGIPQGISISILIVKKGEIFAVCILFYLGQRTNSSNIEPSSTDEHSSGNIVYFFDTRFRLIKSSWVTEFLF